MLVAINPFRAIPTLYGASYLARQLRDARSLLMNLYGSRNPETLRPKVNCVMQVDF
jgi:hypothetical protein